MSDQELAKLFSQNEERRRNGDAVEAGSVDESAATILPAVEMAELLEQADFARDGRFKASLRQKLLAQVSRQESLEAKRKKAEASRPWFSAFQTVGGVGMLVLLAFGLSYFLGNVRFINGQFTLPGGSAKPGTPTVQANNPLLVTPLAVTRTVLPTKQPASGQAASPSITPTLSPFSQDAPWIIAWSGTGFEYYQPGKSQWAAYKNPNQYTVINISPYDGGDWVAIHGVKDAATGSGQYLEWLHLTDGQIIPITRLDTDWPAPVGDWAKAALDAVTRGKAQWSPDGRSLAFQAAKFGSENTDIYIARTDQSGIIQLTHQALNAELMTWSPDGSQIIYAENHSCDSAGCKTDSVWSVSLDGKAQKLYTAPRGTGEVEIGFTSPDHMIVYTKNDTWTMRLRQIDLSTGLTESIYSGYFYSAAVDPTSGKVLFNALQPGFDQNTYLVSRPDKMQRLNLDPSQTKIAWLPEIDQFLLGADGSQSNGITLVSPEGTITRYPNEKTLPSASPDRRYLIFTDQTSRLYDLSGNQLRTLSTPANVNPIWSLDSKGFFYINQQTLYYQELSKPEPTPVGPHIPGGPIDSWLWVF